MQEKMQRKNSWREERTIEVRRQEKTKDRNVMKLTLMETKQFTI